MTLAVGDAAPAFSLPTDTGTPAAPVPGKVTVLYFYPKDDTSGCTNEAKAFSALADDFAKAGAQVIGVSKDSVASHAKFRAKYGLTIALGSDPEGGTIEAFGSWIEKSMYGRNYMGIDRSTFVIGGDGKVKAAWRKVKVPGHAEAVLAAVQALA
jgi:peroxiredoxin Q/BCP